jgi:hypothetical protein
MRWAVVLLVLYGCTSTEDSSPTRAQCQKLRAHVVELRVAGLAATDADRHREALTASLGDEFVDRCQQLSAAEVKCAFAAKDSTSVTACSTSH